jgi:imidazolonepropionase
MVSFEPANETKFFFNLSFFFVSLYKEQTMSKILIKNIKGLYQAGEVFPAFVKGVQMSHVPVIENAFLAIENDTIVAYGSMDDMLGIDDWRNLEIIDASGKYVLPAFCDSHTHIVFAKSRESEFVDKINGLTYEQIAAKGGGILNSARALQQLSEEELYHKAYARLNEIMATGTGAVEIKSGYGLTPEAELKMLRVIKRLKETHPLTIKATFWGRMPIRWNFARIMKPTSRKSPTTCFR